MGRPKPHAPSLTMMEMGHNMTPASQKRIATIWAVLGCGGLLMVLMPIIEVVSMGSGSGGGAPMLWIGMLIAITSFMIAFIYRARARLIYSIMDTENILLRWGKEDDGVEPAVVSIKGLLSGPYMYNFHGPGGGLLKVTLRRPRSDRPGRITFLIEDAFRKNSTTTEFFLEFPERYTPDVENAAKALKAQYGLK